MSENMIDNSQETLASEQTKQAEVQQSTQTEPTPQPEAAAAVPEAEQPAAQPAEGEATAAAEPQAEPQPQAEAGETPADEKTARRTYNSKDDVVARLKEIAQNDEKVERAELESLKQLYYKLHQAEVAAARQAFIEGGGNEDGFTPAPDATEETFKAEMQLIKERRAKAQAEEEQQRRDNLEKKQAILEQMKALIAEPEESGRSYDKFKQLREEWKAVGPVPPEENATLWRNYQHVNDQFYDQLKLNHEFREYDFKKNLEIKTRLCEAAEKLADEPDPISAFHQLQKLHQEFREAGPVAKDVREQVWARFKAASTVVNKRHQAHFEQLKAHEEENLTKKTALCEKVEGFELDKLKTFADWDKVTKEIIALQAEWKKVGFTPKKVNTQIYERFRAACDKFFQAKSEHFKQIKPQLQENLKKKQALAEQAEALKDSTEWNKTTAALVRLQKEWKEIGATQRAAGERLWHRFNAACNAFFEARSKATAEQRSTENENLAQKRGIIEELKSITADAGNDAREQVRQLMQQWSAVGHIPYKYKDKLYEAYRAEVDRLFKELDMRSIKQNLSKFQSRIKKETGSTIDRERERLYRTYEQKKQEIQTAENNMGFFTSKSKSGNSLLDEMKRKIEKLRQELDTLKQKIEMVDEQKAEKPAATEPQAAEAPKAEEQPEAAPAEKAE